MFHIYYYHWNSQVMNTGVSLQFLCIDFHYCMNISQILMIKTFHLVTKYNNNVINNDDNNDGDNDDECIPLRKLT